MFSGPKKPYSAVTVQIDRLTSEQYEEDDFGGIIDLVEVIRIQSSGPTEAARALRKKLKYGNAHRQVRALVILDGLIQNAGTRFQKAFADEPLLERLRLLARDDVVDAQVRQKAKVLFIQWANAYKDTPGLQSIANLYKELPKSQRPAAAKQKVLRETEPFENETGDSHRPAPAPPTSSVNRSSATSSAQLPSLASAPPSRPVTLTPTSSGFHSKLSKGKKSQGSGKPFNLAKEKESMTNCIAQSSIASTNLLNGLQLVNRENERVSENKEVVNRFEICKTLRRQILVYIQHVESDDWIGSLVNANDELVKALTAYEIMDRSIDDDSDSDEWERSGTNTPQHGSTVSADTQQQLAGLSLNDALPAKPPRPAPPHIPMPPVPNFQPHAQGASEQSRRKEDDDENDDDDDPFGDSNAAVTPFGEPSGLSWK
ncbi:protein lsb5-like protein [Acrodontium crateriforme]|uniref:Protein lsb5-like protein n=1 Tax=Acrodontium crateriforme TaxID=150365 RepID=A0AAQ3R9S8_9PEZI|nr:protein lsb5-like protein [Acrodontium crateriforme]